MDELKHLGPRLRSARQDRGLTLEELASKAGMSASTLSRLESGKRQASLELLLPLTRQLGVRIDDLLEPPNRDPRVSREAIRREGMIIAPLTRQESEVHAFKMTYLPGQPKNCCPQTHEGYEWFYVLSGEIRLILGDREHIISQGEAAEFDTREPHAMQAAGTKPAEIISLFNTASERLHLHGDPEASTNINDNRRSTP